MRKSTLLVLVAIGALSACSATSTGRQTNCFENGLSFADGGASQNCTDWVVISG